MSNIRKLIYILLLLFCVGCGGYIIYTSQPSYSVADPYLTVSGVSGASIKVGETKKFTIKAHNAITADGHVSVDDASCLQIISVTSAFGSGTYFAAIDSTGEGLNTVGTITVKGLKECTGHILIKNAKLGDEDMKERTGLSARSGDIKVSNPTSTTTTQAPQQVQQPTQQQNNQTPSAKPSGSGNNLLSSLVIAGYDLNKKFRSSITDYSINVGSTVKSVTVDAKPQDSNAKVSISGNGQLKSGKNNITIVVTAENGSKKKYVVSVIKEIDPNDTSEEVKGEEKEVEAVIVDETPVEDNNTYLKELVVSNAKLNRKFDKHNYIYYYSSSKEITIDKAVPENEQNTVSTYKVDNSTIIIVEDSYGNKGFYLLIKKDNKALYLSILIITILSITCIDLFIYIHRIKKDKK